ncbi:UNVERIFIED_CONTAM: Zinc finger A20 and AN1 domain-containing stress-associated protein 1 [Sesamum radiatum]|uniref:Zinc finger A20 and AN1 domain-containing stress-associated protein 1 n=1 Tax=Sesamum radiatum TaxID=300843 RepID=A0AAW2IL76_SESRA
MAEEHGFQAPEGHRFRVFPRRRRLSPPSRGGGGSVSPDAGAAAAAAAAAADEPVLHVQEEGGADGVQVQVRDHVCGTHRYPEKHGCTFDFKAVEGRAIAKANPVVKADKLEKI